MEPIAEHPAQDVGILGFYLCEFIARLLLHKEVREPGQCSGSAWAEQKRLARSSGLDQQKGYDGTGKERLLRGARAFDRCQPCEGSGGWKPREAHGSKMM